MRHYHVNRVLFVFLEDNVLGQVADFAIDPYPDEAGLPRTGNGVRFSLMLDPLPSTESFRNVAAYIRQALGKVGIAVTVRAQEFGTYVKRIYTDRDFDFAYAWLINGTDPSRLQTYYSSKSFKPGVPFSTIEIARARAGACRALSPLSTASGPMS